MNSSNDGGAGAIKMVIRLLLIVFVLVALYYLYKYLFTSSGLEIQSMNDQFLPADKATGGAATFSQMFDKQVYSGGELTVNIWVYLQDLQRVNPGAAKHIFSLGKVGTGSGSSTLTGEQTMVVYLEPNTSNLKVGISTEPTSGTDNSTTIMGSPSSIPTSNVQATVRDVELQKWVMLTFALNNKILDIYMDGKLARSVVLPAMYKVGGAATYGLYLNAAAYGGFGGFLGNIKMANYALNPEEVWRLYMSGPSAPFSIGNWIKGLFDPEYLKSLTIPGMD
jgi:hypothetical protein